MERVLSAALGVFDATGPDGFKLTAVTEASGVSVGSIYHHFGSFDGLGAALYSRCMTELMEELVARLLPERTPRGGVVSVVAGYLEWAAANPAQARFIHGSAYARFLPVYRERILAAKEPSVRKIAAWLQPHIESGAVVDLPEPLLEVLVIGPATEFTRRWLSAPAEFDITEAARVLPEQVWHAVRGTPSERTP